MESLKGKNAIVTGAGKGLGKAISIALAQEGVNVALIGRTEKDLISVADELKKPFVNSVLRKVRHTAEQSGLLPTERRKNLRNAFAPTSKSLIQGKQILLVDDVLTTGTTANQVAKVLMSAGAKKVVVAVLARSFGR